MPISKQWICEQLGYSDIIEDLPIPLNDSPSPIEWLKKIKKRRDKYNVEPNVILNSDILDKYELLPYYYWIKEGISYSVQVMFQVGIDVYSDRIIFPVHNKYGELIGVKGRYIGKDEETLNFRKYVYLHSLNKSLELFNYHRSLPYIKKYKKVYIFEGAKSVMKAYSLGIYNCVSIEGDDLSCQQIKLLKELGIEVELIFAFDIDKDEKFIYGQVKQIKGRKVYSIYDKNNLLGDKSNKYSPVDLGYDMFNKLIINNKYRIKTKG